MNTDARRARPTIAVRCVRRLRLAPNELRRPSDRLEGLALAITWLLLAGAVLAASFFAARAYEEDLRTERRHAATLQPVTAVLAEDAASSVTMGPKGDSVAYALATARWNGPDGSSHTGRIPVDIGEDRGSRVVIWTDQHGRPAAVPQSDTQVAGHAVMVGAGLAGGIAVGIGLIYTGVRVLLDRQRLRRWERDWARVEPKWTHRPG